MRSGVAFGDNFLYGGHKNSPAILKLITHHSSLNFIL